MEIRSIPKVRDARGVLFLIRTVLGQFPNVVPASVGYRDGLASLVQHLSHRRWHFFTAESDAERLLADVHPDRALDDSTRRVIERFYVKAYERFLDSGIQVVHVPPHLRGLGQSCDIVLHQDENRMLLIRGVGDVQEWRRVPLGAQKEGESCVSSDG